MINEMTMLKANIMGGMNEYIKKIGDDDLWDLWIRVFPDECSEDELMEMAEDDDTWFVVVRHFSICLQWMNQDWSR